MEEQGKRNLRMIESVVALTWDEQKDVSRRKAYHMYIMLETNEIR